MLHEFSCSELCYILNAYHKANYLPKQFASELEDEVKKYLINGEELEPD